MNKYDPRYDRGAAVPNELGILQSFYNTVIAGPNAYSTIGKLSAYAVYVAALAQTAYATYVGVTGFSEPDAVHWGAAAKSAFQTAVFAAGAGGALHLVSAGVAKIESALRPSR